MGGLGVKVQHFPLTLLVVFTTLTLPCKRDSMTETMATDVISRRVCIPPFSAQMTSS